MEIGNGRRYRGRGFIQLTGEVNYRAAGRFLGVDLLGNPDLAQNVMVSPAVAAWYWTVARTINLAADELDMAAVNIAVGFAPNVRRDGPVRRLHRRPALLQRRHSRGRQLRPHRGLAAAGLRRRGPGGLPPTLPGLVPQAPSAPAATVAPDLSSVPSTGRCPAAAHPAPEGPLPTPAPGPAPARPRLRLRRRRHRRTRPATDPRHGPARHGPADHGHVHDGHVHDGHDHDGHVHHRRSRRPRLGRHDLDGGTGLHVVHDAVREPVLTIWRLSRRNAAVRDAKSFRAGGVEPTLDRT